MRAGVSPPWKVALATDLAEAVPSLAVPASFLHGIHDCSCAYPEAKAYVERLAAPLKGFSTFQRSAHSPIFEEPDTVRQILLEDVLAGRNRLADA